MRENKNIIESAFDNNINKTRIHDKVIRKYNLKYINFLKFSLVPICIVITIIFLGITIFNKNGETITNNSNEMGQNDVIEEESQEEINKTTEFIGTCEDTKFKEIVKEEKCFSKIKFPSVVDEIRCMKIYNIVDGSKKDISDRSTHKLRGEFAGYCIIFGNDEKNIEIFVSKTFEHRIGEVLDLNYFRGLKLLGNELKVKSWDDDKWKRILFNYDGLYWDIEMFNLTQKEISDLIESIIL